MTVSIERNCASRIGRVGIPDGCWHDLIFFNLILNQMKITDNTNQKSDNRTFEVGDMVRIRCKENDGTPHSLAFIAHVGNGFYSPVLLSEPSEFWQQMKKLVKGKFVFDGKDYTYTKVNAELIITD